MTTSSRLRSTLVPVLSLSLLLSSGSKYGNVAFAASEQDPATLPQYVTQSTKDLSFPTSTRTEKQELEPYRTAHSKRYLNPDGTFTETVYTSPVHYKDTKTNKWEEIDSTLVQQNDGSFQNKANRFTVKLQDKADKGFISITEGNVSLSFRPLFSKQSAGISKGSHLDYKNVVNDTDLTYDVTPNGLKETVVLNNANAPSIFSYELKVDGLTYELEKDGTLDFFKTGTQTPFFTLAKPFMEDANHSRSNDVSYQIHKDNQNKIILDVTPDAKWLQNSKRAYPVLIDPTVNASSTGETEAEPFSGNPDTNYTSTTSLDSIGGTGFGVARTLHRFPLPSLPIGANVTDATFTVTNASITNNTQAPYVEAHRILNDWSADKVTWNTMPVAAGVDGATGTYESKYNASNTTTPATWTFNVANLVKDWYNGKQANYGIELKFANESLGYRDIYPANYAPNPSQGPALSVTFKVDGLGRQSFWTFDGPVNMASGNLALSANDISYAGRKAALAVNRTYNSHSTSSGYFGTGWSSVLDSRLTILPKGPARYIDAGGTVYYFSRNVDDSFTSPDGLYWSLTVAGNQATITTRDQIRYTFTDASSATAFTSGPLSQVIDTNQNKTTYKYTANQTTIGDDAGHSINLAISGGHVQQATDPAGRVWTYGYNSNGNLTSVTNPLSQKVQYRYDSSNRLTATVSPKLKTTYYLYPTDPQDPKFRNVISVNPTNMVTNPSFEVDSGGTILPDHYAFGKNGLDGQASVDNTSGIPTSSTGKSLHIAAKTTNSVNYSVYVSEPIAVDPTRAYAFSGYLMAKVASGTHTTVLSLLATDSSGNQTEVARISKGNAFTWTREQFMLPVGTLPASTVNVSVKLAASSGTTQSGSTTIQGSGESWFDGVQLEEATDSGLLMTDFVAGVQYTADPASMKAATYDGEGHKKLYTYNDKQNIEQEQRDPIIAGSSETFFNLTDKFTWDSVNLKSHTDANGGLWQYYYSDLLNNNNKGNLTQITDPKNLSKYQTWDSNGKSLLVKRTGYLGSKEQFTYDNSSNSRTSLDQFNTSAGTDVDSYGNVTSLTSGLGWADNLLENSSFENGVNSDGSPIHYSFGSGQVGTWSLDTSNPVIGMNDLGITANASLASNNTVLHSDAIPYDNTADYVLAGYLKGTQVSGTQETILGVDAYNGTTFLGEVGIQNSQNSFDWQRNANLLHPSDFPSGTTTLYVKLQARNTSGVGASYFDAIQLQKNPVDTAYNLIDNGSFERGNVTAGDWSVANSGTTGWTNNANSVFAGQRSVYIAAATTSTQMSYSNFVPYDANQAYSMTAMVKTVGLTPSGGGGIAGIKIEEFDSNKNKIDETVSTKISGDNDWQLLTVELPPAKSDSTVAYLRPAMISGNSPGFAYFDNVRLTLGNINTSYSFDPTGTWTQSFTDPIGNTTTYLLDPKGTGNILQSTDPMGLVTTKTYDALDRLLTNTPPGNDVMVQNEYDNDGNLTTVSMKSADGKTEFNHSSYSYDAWNQEASFLDPLSKKTTFLHNGAGNLVESHLPTGGKVTYTYDRVNRMTDFSLYDSQGKKFNDYNFDTLDANGNKKIIKDNVLSHNWSSVYDKLNQLTQWKDDNGIVDLTPDDNGRVTTRVVSNAAKTVSKTFATTYNASGQPIAETEPNNNVNSFLFTEDGMLSSLRFGNKITQNMSYDSNNRATELQNRNSAGSVLSNFHYTYDGNGRILKVTGSNNNVDVNAAYTYTSKGQLRTETLSSGNTVTYSYDPVGNLTTRLEKKPDNTVVSTANYSYDSKYYHLTSVNTGSSTASYTYDESSNITSNGKYSFKWDSANRLIEVDNAINGTWVSKYQYDYMNRRIQQMINKNGTSLVTNFLYDGLSNHVAAEFDSSGNMTKYYTWSPTGLLLSVTTGVNSATPSTYYTLHDNHGNIVQLTDKNGQVVASYIYDAWGNLLSQLSDTVIAINPYRYSDYRMDDETGLYYLIGRYYDSTIGRFLSTDPTSKTPNYWYVNNNPVMESDHTGYRPMSSADEMSAEETRASLEYMKPNRDAVTEEVTQARTTPQSRAAQGNRVHYDKMNGSSGRQLPTKLQEKYPDTEFDFAKRFQPGPDVTYKSGPHPSEYEGSTWDPENMYGDFKPNTKSGFRTFLRDIRKGKFPENTEFLGYNTTTEELVDKVDSVAAPKAQAEVDAIVESPTKEFFPPEFFELFW